MIPADPKFHPYWYYHQFNTAIAAPVVGRFFSPQEGYFYLLEKAFIQYPAVGGAAPTVFASLLFQIQYYSPEGELMAVPLPVHCFTSPDMFENFAPNLTPNNQQWLGGKSISQPVPLYSKWLIQVSGFLGAANPGAVDLLLVGKNYEA